MLSRLLGLAWKEMGDEEGDEVCVCLSWDLVPVDGERNNLIPAEPPFPRTFCLAFCVFLLLPETCQYLVVLTLTKA